MNPVHLHLALNHIPVIGLAFVLLLMVIGVARRSSELKKTALWFFVLVAILAVPAYLTGEPAEEIAEKIPGLVESKIESHEDTAKIAFALIVGVGVVALAGLAVLRAKPVPQWFAVALLILSLPAAGMLAWTANLGGLIRHPEIENAAPVKMTGEPTHK